MNLINPLGKATLLVATLLTTMLAAQAQTTGYANPKRAVNLGEAAPAPPSFSLKPPLFNGIEPAIQPPVTGGLVVNTDAREEVRSFYNGIFPASENVSQESTADASNCFPGHNSDAFQNAELLRINWYRAMAGVPANIILNPIDDWGSQQMAVIISANNALNHNPPSSYDCYNTFAAGYAGGDQSIGADGADATTDFIWDFGASNNETGHRRWILYPEQTVMGVGDVAGSSANSTSTGNLTYVFDSATLPTRPTTRQPYVSWPPEGYVPYQVVFPYWSFGLSNGYANFTNATVTMTSNGVGVAVAIQPIRIGYGEDTLVWVPMGLDPTSEGTTFPFDGTDTVYQVTIGNILYNGMPVQYSYNVTVFDPAVPGSGYIPTSLTGPAQMAANSTATFSATAPADTNVTSYNFLTAQLIPGNLTDNANNGLSNFIATVGSDYSVITSWPFGSGNCFNLEHYNADAYPQLLQFAETIFPSTNASISFESGLGYATTDEVARVQVSADGGMNWKDLFAQLGDDAFAGNFTAYNLSLSNYVGTAILLRFNFDFQGGSYYNSGSIGWYFTDIVLTNVEAYTNQIVYSAKTNIVAGNLVDSANNGLGNFTVTPPPYYYVITNPPVGSEPNCFHLCHQDSTSQYLQFNEVFLPNATSSISFSGQMGYATSDETAYLEVSTNDWATWDDYFVDTGNNNNTTETSFTPYSFSLAPYAGQLTQLRINFAFTGGSYYPQSQNYVGWNMEDIVVTNVQQQTTTPLTSTNFAFTPAQPGQYLLQAEPVIFSQFPLSYGPVKQVTVTPTPFLMVNPPILTNQIVLLNFSVTHPASSTYHLLQTTQLVNTVWTTNAAALLTTNVVNQSYQFKVTNNSAQEFYRIRSP